MPISNSLHLISIRSISQKIALHTKNLKFASLPFVLQNRLKQITAVHSNIAEDGIPSDDKPHNSYLQLALFFLLIGLLSYAVLTLTNPNILFSIIFLFLLPSMLIVAIVFFVMWLANLPKSSKSIDTKKSLKLDFWLWIFFLVFSITIALLMDPYSPLLPLLSIGFAIFSIAFLVFFIRWLINKNKKDISEASKSRLLLWTTFLSSSLLLLFLNIIAYLSFLLLEIAIPFLFIGFIITFIIWLVHLKDKPDPD